jgi:hypothetical protein
LGPCRMFHPPPSVADVCDLFRLSLPSHYRRWIFYFLILHELHTSTSLRPLTPRALPRFPAIMNALTPTGRLFGPCGHELRSGPDGSPCLSRPHFQPFCPQPPHRPNHGICSCSLFLSARGRTPVNLLPLRGRRESFPLGSWRGLRSAIAGSPVGMAESDSRCAIFIMSLCYGRVVHLRQLPTPCCHDAVAFGFRQVNLCLTGTFTPLCSTHSQAHDRGLQAV